jgi:hypothetical protein
MGKPYKGIRAANAQMPVRGHDSPFFAIVYPLDFKKEDKPQNAIDG